MPDYLLCDYTEGERMSIGTKNFILVFFLFLVCLLSRKTWRMGESRSSVQASEQGRSDGVNKFLIMQEGKPFGPYAFTNQSRHSILTSLLESVNAELALVLVPVVGYVVRIHQR